MNYEIAGVKYCCALFGSGKIDEIDARLLKLRQPDWISKAGIFSWNEGIWSISVGIATEDDEWRQDDDIPDFLSSCFEFLHRLNRSDGSALSIHLLYSRKSDGMAKFSPEALGILAALRISLHIDFK